VAVIISREGFARDAQPLTWPCNALTGDWDQLSPPAWSGSVQPRNRARLRGFIDTKPTCVPQSIANTWFRIVAEGVGPPTSCGYRRLKFVFSALPCPSLMARHPKPWRRMAESLGFSLALQVKLLNEGQMLLTP